MSINKAIRKIEPNNYYNLSHIRDKGLFPWVKHIVTVKRIVNRDHEGENLLGTLIIGDGNAREYRIKGSNIIKFLKKYGAAMMIAAPIIHKDVKKEKGGKKEVASEAFSQ